MMALALTLALALALALAPSGGAWAHDEPQPEERAFRGEAGGYWVDAYARLLDAEDGHRLLYTLYLRDRAWRRPVDGARVRLWVETQRDVLGPFDAEGIGNQYQALIPVLPGSEGRWRVRVTIEGRAGEAALEHPLLVPAAAAPSVPFPPDGLGGPLVWFWASLGLSGLALLGLGLRTPRGSPARRLLWRGLLALGGLAILGTLVLWLLLTDVTGALPFPAREDGDGYQGTRLDPPPPAPDFELIDQRGRPVRLAALRGRVVVLTFMDSRCADVCTLTALHLRRAYERLRAAGADVSRLVLIGINVNLEHNTPEAARAFTRRFGLEAVPGWHFLVGPEEALRRVWAAYGAAVDEADAQHTTALYVVDPQGRLRWVISTLVEDGRLRLSLEPRAPTPDALLAKRVAELLVDDAPGR